MCTLSFIPHLNGYGVGMNRDELRSRPCALAPRYFECNGVTAVYPSETLGGTWIAVNAYGQLFALMNWYSADTRTFTAKQRSRGEIIPQMIFDSDFRAAAPILVSSRLAGILPFRLIGIDRPYTQGDQRMALGWTPHPSISVPMDSQTLVFLQLVRCSGRRVSVCYLHRSGVRERP